MPPAEIEIDADLVRALLADQRPDLAERELSYAGHGWDNELYRVGPDLLVRVPRRAVAAELASREVFALTHLAGRLPVAIPTLVHEGRPTAFYPWSWSIVTWLDGVVATALEPAKRTPAASAYAEFLLALHEPAPDGAPSSGRRGTPLAEQDQRVRARLAELTGLPADAADRWRAAVAAPVWEGDPAWVHGDAHPANLLLTPDGELAAVLDWGDVTAGDPATDLGCLWLAFDAEGRRIVRDRLDAAGRYDQYVWARAKGWALHLASVLLTASDDAPDLAEIGRFGIAQLWLDD